MKETLFWRMKIRKFCFSSECSPVVIFCLSCLPNPEVEQLFLVLCKHHLLQAAGKGGEKKDKTLD